VTAWRFNVNGRPVALIAGRASKAGCGHGRARADLCRCRPVMRWPRPGAAPAQNRTGLRSTPLRRHDAGARSALDRSGRKAVLDQALTPAGRAAPCDGPATTRDPWSGCSPARTSRPRRGATWRRSRCLALPAVQPHAGWTGRTV